MYSANILGHQMDAEYGYYYVGTENASPDVQTNFETILGMNGALDLTEQDGVVFFDSIDRTWRFEKVTRTTEYDDVEREARSLRSKLLGRSGRVVFDADPFFYYAARITNIDVSCEDNGRLVAVITAHCDPYRYMVSETSVIVNVATSEHISLHNECMIVAPLVIADSEMALDYTINGASYHVVVSAGEHYISTLILYEGWTDIQISGTGTIEFRYRQGVL